jgi:hypothetical protein
MLQYVNMRVSLWVMEPKLLGFNYQKIHCVLQNQLRIQVTVLNHDNMLSETIRVTPHSRLMKPVNWIEEYTRLHANVIHTSSMFDWKKGQEAEHIVLNVSWVTLYTRDQYYVKQIPITE